MSRSCSCWKRIRGKGFSGKLLRLKPPNHGSSRISSAWVLFRMKELKVPLYVQTPLDGLMGVFGPPSISSTWGIWDSR